MASIINDPVGFILLGFVLAWASRFLPIALAAIAKRLGVSPRELEEYEAATSDDDGDNE